ncbi:MAG: hypothetical protein GTN93_21510 [Anaerolineae bacterium]|nr:hypothetical protein [Anaerolineae bacterium]
MPTEEWEPATKELVDWFLALKDVPEGPIELAPGRIVVDTKKFFDATRNDIDLGPDSPYVRTGSLRLDLQNLKNALESM